MDTTPSNCFFQPPSPVLAVPPVDPLSLVRRPPGDVARPSPNQPGTLRQMAAALAIHASDPDPDRVAAWERARVTAIPHAAERAGEVG